MPSDANNLNFFRYDQKTTVTASDAGQRTLNDWNRQIEAGETCSYIINTINLYHLRTTMIKEGKCQQLTFSDLAEFKQFLKAYIFKDMDTDKADVAVEHAILQWHQAGIQHATSRHTWAYALEYFKTVQIPEPVCTVYFMSTPEGVCINENNTYLEWAEVVSGELKKHTSPDKAPYCAHTSTTYLFTADHIQLQGLSIDCPSSELSVVFDKKPGEDLLTYLTNLFFRALDAFLAQFYSDYIPLSTTEPDEPQTTFTHPPLK